MCAFVSRACTAKQAWSTADDAPPSKVVMNGCLGLFWLSILGRAMVHLCRRYYSVARDQRRLLRLERYTAWQQPTAAAGGGSGEGVRAGEVGEGGEGESPSRRGR